MLLSAALFIIGVIGVMVRRNIIIIFMSIELILNAVNINLVAYSAQLQNAVGPGLRDLRHRGGRGGGGGRARHHPRLLLATRKRSTSTR
jgi:multisubunit Na+/H+ antiporter MnhC subunit